VTQRRDDGAPTQERRDDGAATVDRDDGAADLSTIERLDGAGAANAIEELATLLVDAVDGGASVNFVWPFGLDEARAFFTKVTAAVQAGTRVLLVARGDGGRIVGSVQLDCATPPNQRHRADVVKLLVFRDQRRRGTARALMQAVESEARALGRTLLTLDTVHGSAAEPLYRALGWTPVGIIPGYAVSTAGVLQDAIFFYKRVTA
jgi:GNAT superfamily N-acetyltransferase